MKELRSSEKPIMQQFQASEFTDLPPRLRALVEDNKVIQEDYHAFPKAATQHIANCTALQLQNMEMQV